MNLVLFDCRLTRENLLPFTFTRPLADMRVGIYTIREKWEQFWNATTFTLSEAYLHAQFPAYSGAEAAFYANGAVLPDENLVRVISELQEEQALFANDRLLAFKTAKPHLNSENFEAIAKGFSAITYPGKVTTVAYPWDIFRLNGAALQADFTRLTQGRKSQPLSATNTVIGPLENIFLEEGAVVEASVLNTTNGAIYIGKNAEIMEGCTIRGPLALCDHAVLKMNSKVYGATTLGPHCKAGGELNNVVFFAYSNKAHDGFLGNSVIGAWCNLGADTNNSNLKNNYGEVSIVDYRTGKSKATGLQFCGLFMADHSKCGINTMFNTGTVVGVSCNIFGADFPPKFVPSFSWGGASSLQTFRLAKAMEAAEKMMERRNLRLSEGEQKIFKIVFDLDAKYRS